MKLEQEKYISRLFSIYRRIVITLSFSIAQESLLSCTQLAKVIESFVLGQTRERLEYTIVVGVVSIVLDFGEGKKLRSCAT